ncbi:response regulator [Aquimarina pacifica]|uniref:response regulator n=1 Tax=Aquimarina pacifica TaxID=1296415 RepID=UPI00046F63DA|nr:response regulator [Aquimarina pacifica]
MTKNNRKLCLVDDDVIHQFIIKKLIQRVDNEKKDLLVFSNGEEAIRHLKSSYNDIEQLPDLILLDLNMPVMDGWEFLDEYNSIAPLLKKKIKIYILSSSKNPEDIKKAMTYTKISEYITKPINETQLSSIIEEI